MCEIAFQTYTFRKFTISFYFCHRNIPICAKQKRKVKHTIWRVKYGGMFFSIFVSVIIWIINEDIERSFKNSTLGVILLLSYWKGENFHLTPNVTILQCTCVLILKLKAQISQYDKNICLFKLFEFFLIYAVMQDEMC